MIDVDSKTIGGISDLVVWAPIKDGFIDAFEMMTYETRLRIVAEALHKVRTTAREHTLIEPFSDTAKRILSLLDFRIGVVERDLFAADSVGSPLRPRRYMYLVATFDGPWEPYMRLIHNPLGAFLDLILCNCENYIPAVDTDFETYAKWVRDHQLDSAIFYATTGLTVKDKLYLEKLEGLQRRLPAEESDLKIATMTSDDPDVLAKKVRAENKVEHNVLALEALNVLYRLADFYPPDRLQYDGPSELDDHPTGEGRYLLRAAQSLLGGWCPNLLPESVKASFSDQLSWFMRPAPQSTMVREKDPKIDRQEIQKGLLTSYDTEESPITYGSMVFLQVENAPRAANFLKLLPISYEDPKDSDLHEALKSVFFNLGLTFHGLKKLKVPEALRAEFPKSFRQGMEARAAMLGDVRENHPRRWEGVARNWPPQDNDTPNAAPPISMAEVDLVLQLRTSNVQGYSGDKKSAGKGEPADDNEPLCGDEYVAFEDFPNDFETKPENQGSEAPSFTKLTESDLADLDPIRRVITFIGMNSEIFGIRLLGTQSLFRREAKTGNALRQPTNRDHFGFVDGISQPLINGDPSHPMTVPYGDVLCGYNDGMLDPPNPRQGPGTIMFNGSFLAVRKISQNVELFRNFDAQHERFGKLGLPSLMIGRTPDGDPLVADPKGDNQFDYSKDPTGEVCPFASHIRRANPRSSFHGRRDPKILRRGMSYGKSFDVSPKDDRGIIFMAYGSSLSEQYETIQRWLNGGNSTDIYSGQNDPIFGTSRHGGQRTFRFVKNQKVERITLPNEPFTQLKWGTYLFVPSRSGLDQISDFAMKDGVASDTGDSARGEAIISRIETLPTDVQSQEWRMILSDFLTKDPTKNANSPAVWQAISARGGAYRMDGGIKLFPTKTDRKRAIAAGCPAQRIEEENARPIVIITDEGLIKDVLSDAETFSVKEQGTRLDRSTGSMFVGQDPSLTYWAESDDTNRILFSYREDQAFNDGYGRAKYVLSQIKEKSQTPTYKVELRHNFFSPVLSLLCKYWFSIPDGTHFQPGAWGWDGFNSRGPTSPPRCPGDFLAPSRDAFFPRPNGAIQSYGIQHGQALRAAALALVKEARAAGDMPGTVSSLMYNAIEKNPHVIDKNDVLARNIIGAMVGALAPMDGSFRAMIFDWFETKSFWRLQGAYLANASKTPYDAAVEHIAPAMVEAISVRPSPDLLYRVATQNVRLGNVDVQADDMVVISLAAATQARLERGDKADISLVFGGHRYAARQPKGEPIHACPAYKMATGAMMGVMAALLEAGRIQALPASMIVEIDPQFSGRSSL